MKKRHKIVIDDSYSVDGLLLSQAAREWLLERGVDASCFDSDGRCSLPRHDSRLVECVETLGAMADGEWGWKFIKPTKVDLIVVEIETEAYCIVSHEGREFVITLEDMIFIEKND